MKLSQYIEELQEILAEIGDTELIFSASDPEGNYYNRVSCSPEIRLLLSTEPDEEYSTEDLMDERPDGIPLEEWLDDNCLDEEDLENLHKVVLL